MGRLRSVTLLLVLLVVGCRAVAPANLIEVRNETTSLAHVEFVYAKGLFGVGDSRSVFNVLPGTSQTWGTYEATTLDITVGGQTLHQPVGALAPCDDVLVVLLPTGGIGVHSVPIPGACPSPSAAAQGPHSGPLESHGPQDGRDVACGTSCNDGNPPFPPVSLAPKP
jgi:hypothetical protein